MTKDRKEFRGVSLFDEAVTRRTTTEVRVAESLESWPRATQESDDKHIALGPRSAPRIVSCMTS